MFKSGILENKTPGRQVLLVEVSVVLGREDGRGSSMKRFVRGRRKGLLSVTGRESGGEREIRR